MKSTPVPLIGSACKARLNIECLLHGGSKMSAANLFICIASRVYPLPLLAATLILASVPPALAAPKAADSDSTSRLQSSSPAATAGALRILLVDDDYSDNNNIPGDSRRSLSDTVFAKLVADAVGGDAKSWAIATVKSNANGPTIDKLRPYPLIIWYTGASYGGNPDNSSVLSIEDEKTVRQYLKETGGTVILFSPGYVSKVLEQGSTWEETSWPFLKEVLGIRGGHGLAQRFEPGTVTSSQGTQFHVGKGSAVETQFSAVNPQGAEVVFTANLADTKNTGKPTPIATAFPYGKGRFIYVGFTFENLAAKELTPAFQTLLAATGQQPIPGMSASQQVPVKRQAAAADPAGFTVQVNGTSTKATLSWTLPASQIDNASLIAPGQTIKKKQSAPASGTTVRVERYGEMLGNYHWTGMDVAPGASQVTDSEITPGTTMKYRVTVTDASGASSQKEVAYAAPPAKDPDNLTARLQSDYSVILTWPEVPGVTKYQVQTVSPTAYAHVEPHIVSGATEWHTPPLDGFKRYWAVTSLYELPSGLLSLTDRDNWPRATTEGIDQYFLTVGTFTIYTGNDNKEILSDFEMKLYINGGQTNTDNNPNYQQLNPYNLQDIGSSFGSKDTELKVNSSADFDLRTGVDTVYLPMKNNMANIQQHGLRFVIKYHPNFTLDAWKVDKVTLTLKFQSREQLGYYANSGRRTFSPDMIKTITFSNVSTLLTESHNQIDLITDGLLKPIN